MKQLAFVQYTLFALISFSITCAGQPGQEHQLVREPVVAGTFYPSDPVQLKLQLASFFETSNTQTYKSTVSALIVPHAGYVFSGEVAASAYAQLNPDASYSRIFLIGTSHHTYLDGASIYNKGNYRTPLGIVEVDFETANQLIDTYKIFRYSRDAHSQEHSLEVQLPFLQYRLKKKFKIVPIIIGSQSASMCKKIATALQPYFNNENLFVISSDFSHYPKYNDAVRVDKITGDAISTNSPELFLDAISKNAMENIPGLATSCCGWSSVLTLLHLSSGNPDIKIEHLNYMNSGDTKYGDKKSVVGYHSFVLFKNTSHQGINSFMLTPEEKTILLKLARQAIDNWLKYESLPSVDMNELTVNLKTPCGVFVTLHKYGQLRGCIGRFMATDPLYKVVQEMAVSAAFHDYRFTPVHMDEMKDIEVEISVLTPLKKINNIDEFELGKHGIYMVKGDRSGTFLPQVAQNTDWCAEEFLGYCARDKAGIGWNGWKDAQLYIYEAFVFNEEELMLTE
ncbi:AmmeMemoRadiSam system protein B [Bacteroidota bacterium]